MHICSCCSKLFFTFAVWLNLLPGLCKFCLEIKAAFHKGLILVRRKRTTQNVTHYCLKPLIAPFLMPSEICVKVDKRPRVWDSLFFLQTLQECKTNSYVQEKTLIFNQTWLSCRTAEQPCNPCCYFLAILCASCFILCSSSSWLHTHITTSGAEWFRCWDDNCVEGDVATQHGFVGRFRWVQT